MTMRSLERERVLRIIAWPLVLLTVFTSSSSEGQERSVAQAVAGYYDAACRADPRENALQCHLLAEAYWMGKGVPQDRARAGQLYRKACEAGRLKACARFTQVQASLGEQPLRGLSSAPTAQPLVAPAGQQKPAPASLGSLKPPSELWPRAVSPSPAASQLEQKKPPSAQPPAPARTVADLMLDPEEMVQLSLRDPDAYVRAMRRYTDETLEIFNDIKRIEPESAAAVESSRAVMEKNMEIVHLQGKIAKELNSSEALLDAAEKKLEEKELLEEEARRLRQQKRQVDEEKARLVAELIRVLQEEERKKKGSER